MANKKILVVEDENIVAIDIQAMLQQLGYSVPALAATGPEAVRQAEQIRPDLVLMDIKLKGEMDGVAAAQHIRSRLDIPVIFLTAYADEATLQRAKITEPYGYLLKPFEERELHTTIEMALYRHQMERKLKESENRYRSVVEDQTEFIVRYLPDGTLTFVNGSFCRYTNRPCEALVGADYFQFFAEADRPKRRRILQSLTPEKPVITAEHRSPQPDGSMAWQEWTDRAIFDQKGALVEIQSVGRDITAAKKAKKEIQRHNRELTLLNRVITASVTRPDPKDFLEVACRELARAFNLPQAVAGVVSKDKTTLTIVAEYNTVGPPAVLNNTFLVEDNAIIHAMFVNQAPVTIENGQTDPRLARFHNLLRRQKTVSMLVLPLITERKVKGLMVLGASEPRQFSAAEVSLAWTVADQIAGSLNRVELEQERRLLSTTLEQAAENIIITDTDENIVYVNSAFEQLTGYSRDEVIGRNPGFLKSGRQDAGLYQEMRAALEAGQMWHGRFTNRKKDGSLYTVEATVAPVRDKSGQVVNYVSAQRDITREVQLEAQYLQAQKMEAIGLLAGGVAHDFNNLLTAINGFAEMIQNQLLPGDPLQEMIEKIIYSGQRAANLTRQLLTFSRKQTSHPKAINLNALVTEMGKMLQRIIGNHIELETVLDDDVWPVKMDPTHIEQIILNLVVNARDAMPNGGVVKIETGNVELDETYAAGHLDVEPGPYVLLTVSDTGCGISETVKSRIFEPFFSTKNRGTGLGLSTVYGIVKQSGGYIWVYSEENRGTTFKIYLPRTSESASPSLATADSPGRVSGRETILLVDDNTPVRELTRRVLEQQGYTVLEAPNAQQALQIVASHSAPVDLLLSDVVMGNMGGQMLAAQLAQTYPNLKVMFMSGYTDSMIAHHGIKEANIPFIEKPFSPRQLARKVREVLDKRPTNGHSPSG